MFPLREVLRRTQFHLSVALLLAASSALFTPTSASAGDFIPLGAKAKLSGVAVTSAASAESLNCMSPLSIAVGDVRLGTNDGAVNNVNQYGCTSWNESGGEVVFSLSIPSAIRVQIDLESDCDLDLALLSGCDALNDCLVVSDTGIRSTVPVSGEFYLVVDGFNGAGCIFRLTVSEFVAPTADVGVCEMAAATSCGSSTLVEGTTCGSGNSISELECSYSNGGGEDRSYRFSVQPGGFLDATLAMPQADGVLWILGGCGTDTECLGFADVGFDGEDEHLRFENSATVTRDVYVIVDSFAANSCANYSLSLECSGSTVAVEAASWSGLKGLYLEDSTHKEVRHD